MAQKSHGKQGSKQKAKDKRTPKKTQKGSGAGTGRREMKTWVKVVIVIFAVIMVLAMMLPSFVSVMQSNQQAAQQQEQQSQDSTDSSDSSSSDSSDSSDDSTDTASLEGVPENLQSLASQYSGTVSTLENKLKDDPNNLAALLNLAHDYMNWGYSAISQSTTDEETSYSQGLLQQAIGYFDRYLELNDANSAKVDRALCQYYSGDTDAAREALEQITQDAPDFAPAWANLGMIYEREGDTDKAENAYQQASDNDPDDEYGAKSFAEQRLIQLKAQENASSSDSESSALSDSSTSEGLTNALADKSGVGL